jgi:hypothetical protein
MLLANKSPREIENVRNQFSEAGKTSGFYDSGHITPEGADRRLLSVSTS